MLEIYIPTPPTIVGKGLCINLYPCMFKFCESSVLRVTSLKEITLGENRRVSNYLFRSLWWLFSEVILRCIRIKQKLKGNTLQSSKRQGAKFEYITSVVLSSNLSALLLLLKLLVNRVRLIEGKAAFETAFKEMVQNQKSCKRQRLLKQVQLVHS